ncbi:MAG: radical SAM protein, partial [Coleofasciculus sp. Co-bin14]|nr:radical SAM protein [Coleofasciculus sp. Co-bin14]
NTPTRPKPLKHQLDGRENHSNADSRPYAVQKLKCVSADFLQAFASKIHNATGILVRCAS